MIELNVMQPMPAGARDGILKGMYKFRAASNKKAKLRAQLFGSGAILNETLRFFLKAEDGMRDIGVTGVQTCALPISTAPWMAALSAGVSPPAVRMPMRFMFCRCSSYASRHEVVLVYAIRSGSRSLAPLHPMIPVEIGRASCRERV